MQALSDKEFELSEGSAFTLLIYSLQCIVEVKAVGARKDRGKFGGMVSRCWCPTAKKWHVYSTLLGSELFLAELCVPKHLNSLLRFN